MVQIWVNLVFLYLANFLNQRKYQLKAHNVDLNTELDTVSSSISEKHLQKKLPTGEWRRKNRETQQKTRMKVD